MSLMVERRLVGHGDVFRGWRVVFIGFPFPSEGGGSKPGQRKSVTLLPVDYPRHPLEAPVTDMRTLDATNHEFRDQ